MKTHNLLLRESALLHREFSSRSLYLEKLTFQLAQSSGGRVKANMTVTHPEVGQVTLPNSKREVPPAGAYSEDRAG